MSHHAIAHDDNFFKSREDSAGFLSSEPPHVAGARDEGGVDADAPAGGEGSEEGGACGADWGEGVVEVLGGDVAVGMVAVSVGAEGVERVWEAVGEGFGWWEGEDCWYTRIGGREEGRGGGGWGAAEEVAVRYALVSESWSLARYSSNGIR